MDNQPDSGNQTKSGVSVTGIIISILSVATAVNMLVNPGPFGTQLAPFLSQLAAGAFLFTWSMMKTRRVALGFVAWFGGAFVGAAIGALLPFL